MRCHWKLCVLYLAIGAKLTLAQFFDDDDDEDDAFGAEASMEAESKAVSAAEGSNVELSCSTYFDDVSGCKFYRPDGQLICPMGFDTMSYTTECVEDPNATPLPPSGTKCSLQLNPVVGQLHHGQWRCQAIVTPTSSGETKINVSGPQRAAVEYVDIWGHVTIDLSESEDVTFRCKVLPDDPSSMVPLQNEPSEMIWKLGGVVQQTSSDYRKNSAGEFVQSFKYTPDLYDDGQNLECSIKDALTGEEVEDQIKLTMIMFKPAEGSDEPVEVKEGEPAAVSLTFEMYPGPNEEEDDDGEGGGEVYWLLNTPNDPKLKLNPGDTQQRFRAKPIEKVGDNTYKATLQIKKIAKWERDHTHKLVVTSGRDNIEPQVIPVKMDVKEAAVAPPAPPPAQIVNPPQQPASSTPLPVATPAGNGTMAQAEVEEAGTSKVSLYVIIAIIALVILFCVLFYVAKTCRKKQAREREAAEAAARNNASGGAGTVSTDKQRLLEEERQQQYEEARKRVEAEMEVEGQPLLKKAAVPVNAAAPSAPPAIVYENEVKVQKMATVETSYLRTLEPQTPSPTSMKSQDTRSTEVDPINAAPFLLVRPLPPDHPSGAEEHEEIDKLTAKIQGQTSSGLLTSPELVAAVARQDQEVMPNGEPVIKMEKVRRHGEPEEEVDDIFSAQEPVIQRAYAEPKNAVPTASRLRSQETEERAKNWSSNPLFRTNTAESDENKDNGKNVASKTLSQASTASAGSSEKGQRWQNVDDDPAEHKGIMENVDKIIANLNSDYPEPPQPQEHKEYVPGGIPLSPAQEGKFEHTRITKAASELREEADVDNNSPHLEHAGIVARSMELREREDVDGNADGEHAAIGDKSDTLRRSKKNKNKKDLDKDEVDGKQNHFVGGFVSPPTSQQQEQINGEVPSSPSVSAASTQTPKLKQKFGGTVEFDSSSIESIDKESKEERQQMKQAEQSMFM